MVLRQFAVATKEERWEDKLTGGIRFMTGIENKKTRFRIICFSRLLNRINYGL